MRFFKIFFTVWLAIGLYNCADTIIQYEIRPDVYNCADVIAQDPLNVQKACHKYEFKPKTNKHDSQRDSKSIGDESGNSSSDRTVSDQKD